MPVLKHGTGIPISADTETVFAPSLLTFLQLTNEEIVEQQILQCRDSSHKLP